MRTIRVAVSRMVVGGPTASEAAKAAGAEARKREWGESPVQSRAPARYTTDPGVIVFPISFTTSNNSFLKWKGLWKRRR